MANKNSELFQSRVRVGGSQVQSVGGGVPLAINESDFKKSSKATDILNALSKTHSKITQGVQADSASQGALARQELQAKIAAERDPRERTKLLEAHRKQTQSDYKEDEGFLSSITGGEAAFFKAYDTADAKLLADQHHKQLVAYYDENKNNEDMTYDKMSAELVKQSQEYIQRSANLSEDHYKTFVPLASTSINRIAEGVKDHYDAKAEQEVKLHHTNTFDQMTHSMIQAGVNKGLTQEVELDDINASSSLQFKLDDLAKDEGFRTSVHKQMAETRRGLIDSGIPKEQVAGIIYDQWLKIAKSYNSPELLKVANEAQKAHGGQALTSTLAGKYHSDLATLASTSERHIQQVLNREEAESKEQYRSDLANIANAPNVIQAKYAELFDDTKDLTDLSEEEKDQRTASKQKAQLEVEGEFAKSKRELDTLLSDPTADGDSKNKIRAAQQILRIDEATYLKQEGTVAGNDEARSRYVSESMTYDYLEANRHRMSSQWLAKGKAQAERLKTENEAERLMRKNTMNSRSDLLISQVASWNTHEAVHSAYHLPNMGKEEFKYEVNTTFERIAAEAEEKDRKLSHSTILQQATDEVTNKWFDRIQSVTKGSTVTWDMAHAPKAQASTTASRLAGDQSIKELTVDEVLQRDTSKLTPEAFGPFLERTNTLFKEATDVDTRTELRSTITNAIKKAPASQGFRNVPELFQAAMDTGVDASDITRIMQSPDFEDAIFNRVIKEYPAAEEALGESTSKLGYLFTSSLFGGVLNDSLGEKMEKGQLRSKASKALRSIFVAEGTGTTGKDRPTTVSEALQAIRSLRDEYTMPKTKEATIFNDEEPLEGQDSRRAAYTGMANVLLGGVDNIQFFVEELEAIEAAGKGDSVNWLPHVTAKQANNKKKKTKK